jgi:transcriptional regulator
MANHVPLLYDPEPAPYGTLRGHVARANPLWHDSRPEFGVLAVFQGPQAYISPSFYPSKVEHGKVVPTWNYAVVHAHSRELIVHDDPAWVSNLVVNLTDAQEALSKNPWHVSDAPEDYIQGRLQAIVGIEMRIDRLEGKWKASQNQNAADYEGACAGLDASDDLIAKAMAAVMRSSRD